MMNFEQMSVKQLEDAVQFYGNYDREESEQQAMNELTSRVLQQES